MIAFVAGFVILYTVFGVLAGFAGQFFSDTAQMEPYLTPVRIVAGVVVIYLALQTLGVFRLPFVINLPLPLFGALLLLQPALLDGASNFVGRVMDGSFHFVPPSGNASDALIFSVGFFAHPNGISYTSTPVYYSLATVSDTAAEPIPMPWYGR